MQRQAIQGVTDEFFEVVEAGCQLLTSMNCISWNCRGLGQSQVILELTELVQKYSSSIIFLMETRSKEIFLKKLCSKLHIENVFIVP